jgi:hypothetical protein
MINLSRDAKALNNALTSIVVDLYLGVYGKAPGNSIIFSRKKPNYSTTVYYDDVLDQYRIDIKSNNSKTTKGPNNEIQM